MTIPIYKAKITSDDDVMDFMGFVEQPAHGKEMRFFKPTDKAKQVFNDERQLVTGVAISTNQLIYRKDASGEYNMYFDKQTTRELGRRLLARNFGGNVNVNHDHNQIVKSARIDEIFYVDKSRGIEAPREFAGQNLQDGSMLITYHIADKKEFQALKEKNLNGLSIEVFIDVERTKFEKANQKPKIKMKENKSKGFFEKVKALFEEEAQQEEVQKVFAEAVSVDGLNLKWEGDLVASETVVYITSEEEEDVLAPEGVHVITKEDKQIMLTVGADGVLESVEEVEATEDENEMSEVEQAVEMMAKQFKTQSDELTEAKKTIQSFTTRFENIEKQLDTNKPKKDTPVKMSVGQFLKKNQK